MLWAITLTDKGLSNQGWKILKNSSRRTCPYVFVNLIIEPVHEISNNVVCATRKASDQPAHTRSLIRAFASRLSIL